MTPNATQRYRILIAGTAIVAGLLTTAAAPAWADDSDKAANQVCWIEAETGAAHCYSDQAAMQADLIENYGGLPIEEGTARAQLAARGASTAAVKYLIAALYPDISYGGTYIPVYGSTSTWCPDGNSTNVASMTSGNDTISSVKAFFGCRAYLFDNVNYGSQLGAWTTNSNLGIYSDRTSSYKIRA